MMYGLRGIDSSYARYDYTNGMKTPLTARNRDTVINQIMRTNSNALSSAGIHSWSFPGIKGKTQPYFDQSAYALRSSLSSLRESTNALNLSKEGNVFSARKVSSDNSDVTASVVSNAKLGTYQVKVDQVAGKEKPDGGKALNSQYTVDGKAYNSSNTTAHWDSGKVKMDLGKVKPGTEAKITVSRDADAVVKGIQNFAADYNKTVNTLASRNDSASRRIKESMAEAVNGKEKKLFDMGITLDSKNNLKIDETKLRAAIAADSDKVAQTIGGADGLATRSSRLTRHLQGSLHSEQSQERPYTGKTWYNEQQENAGRYRAYQNVSQYMRTQTSFMLGQMFGSSGMFGIGNILNGYM